MKTATDHEKAGLRKQNAGTVLTVSQNITDRSDSTVQTAVNYGMASYVAAARPVASFWKMEQQIAKVVTQLSAVLS